MGMFDGIFGKNGKKEFPNLRVNWKVSKKKVVEFVKESDERLEGLLREVFGDDEFTVTSATELVDYNVLFMSYGGLEFAAGYLRDSRDRGYMSATFSVAEKTEPHAEKHERPLLMVHKLVDRTYKVESGLKTADYETIVKPHISSSAQPMKYEAGEYTRVEPEGVPRDAVGRIVKEVVSHCGRMGGA